MTNESFPIGVSNNPATHNLWCQEDDNDVIAPGNPQFIITQSGLKIITQNNYYLITEGS